MVIYYTIVCAEKIHFYQDDILPKLMAGVGSHDDLFKKEIAKYDSICAEIADNIMAQEQLLLQIQVTRKCLMNIGAVCFETFFVLEVSLKVYILISMCILTE